LRIVRVGSTVTAWFKDADHDWTSIGTADQGTGDLYARLGFWGGGDSFSGQNYQVAFDNFFAWSGDIFVVPEYAFGALLAFAACFAAFMVIKRPKLNLKRK
jgi:hypothetical protein